MRTFLRSKALLVLAFGLLLAVPAIALADNLQDSITTGSQTKTIGSGTANAWTNNYWVDATGSGTDIGPGNCDIPDGGSATFKLNVPSGVTATSVDGTTADGSPKLVFTACGTSTTNTKTVTFSSNTPGVYSISADYVSGTGGVTDGFNEGSASLTLTVLGVSSVSPANGATDVAANANVTATFNDDMNSTTINTSNFKLVKDGTSTVLPAAVSYASGPKTATLNPSSDLLPGTKYNATIVGGASGVKSAGTDAAPLEQDKTWSFTTAGTPPTPVNTAPVATNDNYNATEDTTLNVTAANGVLANDIDTDPLTATVVATTSHGVLTLNTNGSFSYAPDAEFNGTDSFTYRASDGTATSNVATVTITVAAVNDAPTQPGAITSTESLNNDGTFRLDWGPSNDVVDGDNVTYTLEKRDANDASWSNVASGLTSASYTFGASNALAEGTWDFRVKAVDDYTTPASSAYSEALDLVQVDKSNPYAPTLSFATTGQSLKVTVDSVDWYKDSVKIDVADNGDRTLSDTSAGSGVDASSFPTSFSVTTNGPSTASKTVKDNATNESTAGTLAVNVDAANPTLDTSCPTAGPFILNSGGGTQSVTIGATDGESGIDNAASTLTGTVDTSTVGTKAVDFKAVDNVGHESATKQCTYSVNYSWNGFRQPVDNGTTFNVAKAGSAIPMKFSLSGFQGYNILNPAPSVTKVNCPSNATLDAIEEYAGTTTSNAFNYDASIDQYNYVWKTQSGYAGNCYRFDMKLIDGTTHSALFKFSK